MRKSPLRRISVKQAKKNKEWALVKAIMINQFGRICQWCGRGEGGHIIKSLEGHHKDKNRNNNQLSNCYLVIGECHDFIGDKNIDVQVYKTRAEWLIKVMCTYCGNIEEVEKSVADKLDETTAYCCNKCLGGKI